MKNPISFDFNHDRRRFIRLSLDPALKVNFKLEPAKSHFELVHGEVALIKNISIGGGLVIELMLESDEAKDKILSGAKKIRLDIVLPGETASQVKISGKIVWLKKMASSEPVYEAGIAFENINEKAQEAILHAMIDLAFKQKNINA